MKLSRFVVFIPVEDGYLAYNTLTQAVLFLDQPTKETLIQNPTAVFSDTSLAPVIEEKFLVSETTDETQVIQSWFDEINQNNSILNLTVLTTYACNLACVYCVEKEVIQPIVMDPAIQSGVVQWIANQVREKQIPIVRLCFYGGEPLLNIPAIETISTALNEYYAKKEFFYKGELITNGVLLTKDIAEKLPDWGIKQVKITLDGNQIQHNRKRPTKNGTDSYQAIFNNLNHIPESVDLIISGNYDSENISSFSAMLDDLQSFGLENRIKYISFKPIINTTQAKAAVAAQCTSISLGEADLSAMVSLRNAAKERGFNVPDYLVLGPCEFNYQNSLVIDPVGNFYKCAGFVGRPEFCIGNIQTGFNDRYPDFSKVPLPQKCIECNYVPVCGGGCRYCAQIKYGDYRQVVCEYPYFETVGKEVLKSDYYSPIAAK